MKTIITSPINRDTIDTDGRKYYILMAKDQNWAHRLLS